MNPFRERTSFDAPVWYDTSGAEAWAAGYNTAVQDIHRLERSVTPSEPLGTGCTGDPCGANGCPKCDGLLPSNPMAPNLPDDQEMCPNCDYVRFRGSVCTKCGDCSGVKSVAYIGKRTGTPRFEGTPAEPLGNPDSQADGAADALSPADC